MIATMFIVLSAMKIEKEGIGFIKININKQKQIIMKKIEIGCLVECDNLKDVRIMEIIVNRFALNYITNIWMSYSVEAVIDVESHTLLDSDYSEFFKDGCRAIYEIEKKGDIIYIYAFDPKEIRRREVINCKSLFEYDVVIAENNNDYARLKQESLINVGSQIRR